MISATILRSQRLPRSGHKLAAFGGSLLARARIANLGRVAAFTRSNRYYYSSSIPATWQPLMAAFDLVGSLWTEKLKAAIPATCTPARAREAHR
jgi:hypothetical protein